LESYTLTVAPMGVNFGTDEETFGPILRAKYYPHRCNVSPLRGEKPQHRPLSKLNTDACASRNATGNKGSLQYNVEFWPKKASVA